jgi:hydroxyethylthiazole kinase
METPHPTAADLFDDIRAVRTHAPLVHNITNFVVMGFNANVLLAVGASPVMAHAIEEVEDMVGIAGALVVNMGTLEPAWVDSMQRARRAAAKRGIPVVFDPVGAGATPYRNRVAAELVASPAPTIIRGNASEILSVAGLAGATRGVDSNAPSDAALGPARALAVRTGGVVCVSGPVDFVVDARGRTVSLANGDALMTRVTGVGCSATALIGAFAAVQPEPLRACAAAMALMGVAGELAAERTRARHAGPGTFAVELLDALATLDAETFEARLRMGPAGAP